MKRIFAAGIVLLLCLWTAGCMAQYGTQESGSALAVENDGGVSAYVDVSPGALKRAEEPSPSPSPEVKTVTIAAVGDVMLMATQIYDAKTESGFDFDPVFSLVEPYIKEADIAVANLETPVAGNEMGFSVSGELREDGTRGYSYFNAPSEILDALKNAGFDILGTANNHALDKNKEGLENTIRAIRAAGLESMGTNLPDEEKSALIKEVNGISIAFLAYTNSVNGNSGGYAGDELSHAVNFIDEDTVAGDIRLAKQSGADIVVLCLHTGEERTSEPTWNQKQWAEDFVAAGADVIFYAHPHVLQPMEWVTAGDGADERQGFVAYSLGNFISNMDGDDCARSVVAYVDIVKDAQGARVEGARYLPTYFYRAGGEYTVLPSIASKTTEIREKIGDSAADTAKSAGERTETFLGNDAANAVR
jgi:poly-gamma-glutamate synthesis protein (capsule biosynthesis protein)